MKTIGYCFLFLLIMHTCPALVYSQIQDATVRGQLTDPSGSALEDVQLTAVHEATQSVYRTRSGPDGEYAFLTLPPGTYRFEAETDGFKKYVQAGIRLSIRQSIRLDISMEPGALDHEVFVYSKTSGSLFNGNSGEVSNPLVEAC